MCIFMRYSARSSAYFFIGYLCLLMCFFFLFLDICVCDDVYFGEVYCAELSFFFFSLNYLCADVCFLLGMPHQLVFLFILRYLFVC